LLFCACAPLSRCSLLAADRTKLVGVHLSYPRLETVKHKDSAYRFIPAA